MYDPLLSADKVGAKSDKKLIFYQIGMFGLTYLCWIFVHMQREFWAMSKHSIQESNPTLSTAYFGAINTCLFAFYAMM